MPKSLERLDYAALTPSASIAALTHGWRAKCLQRLIRIGLPVPQTVALPFATVRAIADGQMVDTAAILALFGTDALVSVRASSENPDWGGPGTLLNIGMTWARHAAFAASHGAEIANTLY